MHLRITYDSRNAHWPQSSHLISSCFILSIWSSFALKIKLHLVFWHLFILSFHRIIISAFNYFNFNFYYYEKNFDRLFSVKYIYIFFFFFSLKYKIAFVCCFCCCFVSSESSCFEKYKNKLVIQNKISLFLYIFFICSCKKKMKTKKKY